MLPSLSIKNYRNLKSLEIDSLARINLIAGKNNTGKTSLLEAISLYASGGDIRQILQILRRRGELLGKKVSLETNLSGFTSLFFDRNYSLSPSDKIIIGELKSDSNILSIGFVQLSAENIVVNDINSAYRVGVEIQFRDSNLIYPLEKELTFYPVKSHFQINFRFVRADNYVFDNGMLWDSIALTEKENYVIDALKLIDSGVQRIAFINYNESVQRTAVVKLAKNNQVTPLSSMGDGMNRILTIILSLVNSENGFLLIDEFENGLHYTVQEDLWKMIFKLAKELNVQVFATTHSDDCIRAFTHVLDSKGNQSEGQYLRLEKFGEDIKPVFYSASELQVAANQYIETR